MIYKLFIFGALSALVGVQAAQAQVTVDVSKITCKQYLAYTVTDPRFIAIWLSGYYNGKRNNMLIDTGAFKKNVDKVEDYCRLNLDETVVRAVEITFGLGK
jgi:acid stress chaperone HdeB